MLKKLYQFFIVLQYKQKTKKLYFYKPINIEYIGI